MHANGYFDTDVISIANLYLSPQEIEGTSLQLEKTTFHELLHASGYVNGAGFNFHDTALQGRAWEEAFVSHSVDVAFSQPDAAPQAEIINPFDRISVPTFSYIEERQLMAHLSSEELADISVDVWARAFFASKDKKYQQQLRQKLEDGFDRIDDRPHSLQLFNDEYEATWEPYDSKARYKVVTAMADKALRYLGTKVETWSEYETMAEKATFMVRKRVADRT
jgi:hypothetical protein